MKQIIETITKSRFGVCYFSEPAPDGDSDNHKFIDNVNVIFEAGMFQSLTNSPNVVPVGWIPIREKESPPPPFDFGKERIVEIPRLADGKLNQDLFIEIFNGRVTNLLEKIT